MHEINGDNIQGDLPLEPEDSPCQLVCSIEKNSNMCFGCGRTPEEIADWPLRSKEERNRILGELPARMPPLRIILSERRALRRTNKRRGKNRGGRSTDIKPESK